VREFEAAEKLDPADYQAHVQLSDLYARLGRQADSKRELHEYYPALRALGFGESSDLR
jgi:hypothetical protein